jgi:hypothetical protein
LQKKQDVSVLQTNGSGVLSFASASAAAGQVIQVVSNTITTALAISVNTTKIDLTNYTVSITPSSASNKILVMWGIMYSNPSGDSHQLYLNRGSTEIAIGTTGSIGYLATVGLLHANGNNYWGFHAGGQYLDSPATTSATTYKFQINSQGSYTSYFNRTARGNADGCYISTMTAMEIKG